MRTLLLAGLLAAAALGAAATATAGECPADKVTTGATDGAGHTANIGATDQVLAVNDLGLFYPELAGRLQRLRMLTIAPGGEIAWHSHAERPAVIYVVSGEIVEHRSTCSQPILHHAGEVAAELGPLEHWWKNEGTATVVLLSADLPAGE